MVDYYSTHFQWAECRNIEKELVFADIECDIEDSRTFTPNFICCERVASDEKYYFWGISFIRDFLEHLMAWVKEKKGKLQPLRIILCVTARSKTFIWRTW